MLDPSQHLILREFPTVRIYKDFENRQVYYVVPGIASLKIADDGRPLLRLLIYMKRDGDRMMPCGGQLTLTTSLEIASPDLPTIKYAIEQHLSEERGMRPNTHSASPMPLRVVSPEWLNGKVEVRFSNSFRVSGQPSLFGENQCALVCALNADQGRVIRDEWHHKCPHGMITYQMVARVAATATSMKGTVGHQTMDHPVGGLTDVLHTNSVAVHIGTVTTLPITVEGPLWRDGLEQQVMELDIT